MDNRLPSLAGHRVVLREPRAADAERLFAYTSDPAVTRFLAFDPPRSVARSLRFIARAEVLRTCYAEYVFTIADGRCQGTRLRRER
jgi:RimJ/RimL family protein N-acetyltransferase